MPNGLILAIGSFFYAPMAILLLRALHKAIPSWFLILFLSLGWQEIKIAAKGNPLLLCNALKWRVAIVPKQRVPMAKPVRVLAGTPRPKTSVFDDFIGFAIAPVSKKLAVK